MRALLQLKQPVLDLLWPFLPRFLTWPSSGFATWASGGDSLVVLLGVEEVRLDPESLKVLGDAPCGVIWKKFSILVGCGVESFSCGFTRLRRCNSSVTLSFLERVSLTLWLPRSTNFFFYPAQVIEYKMSSALVSRRSRWGCARRERLLPDGRSPHRPPIVPASRALGFVLLLSLDIVVEGAI